ncbi:phosphopantothenoylcysteine decarboxylase [Candidatus Falkowbacteria bacterium CG10_big_fil_rev_8_21_14_0_10_39_11]|uniref:Phosphopantothenoylcysteine decarboxylase n=1 Tax=Candidatus Falkowbacteria bacterium CG10_big_fil_rev_8_21_14_0_10_39_11 TaxID=1974565 RepID=A0A2H0V743_9BACT|nr:MAG: phosphopantothenoylcysteine decarboxylase [Candidatus Falkowbacteria bacterium CG10_big_fil_rev_8_21_14_0_10_39_11]
MKVLLGVTGSVATILITKLVDALHEANCEVRVVATKSAEYFFSKKCVGTVPVKVYSDQDEWPKARYEKGDDVLHIQLRDWADVFLIAPLGANTLAKCAQGLCDNLLTCVVRAWDRTKPIVIAPAMNTHMWENPFTEIHLEMMMSVYPTYLVEPINKVLACGDNGVGAMAMIESIIEMIERLRPAYRRQGIEIIRGKRIEKL